jgi:hypothetical protein
VHFFLRVQNKIMVQLAQMITLSFVMFNYILRNLIIGLMVGIKLMICL